MKKRLAGMGMSLVVFHLASCAHKPVVEPTALTLAEFWKEQKTRVLKANNFSAKLSLRFESKAEKTSGSGRVVALGEQRIRLELRDPLGRTQYLLVQVPEGVSIYVPSSKVLYEDKSAGRNYFRRTIGQPLSTLELRKIWLGIAPLAPGVLLEKWHWDYSGEGFRAWKKGHDSTVELLLDGDCGAIKEMKVTTNDGTYLAQYSDFETNGNIHLAHQVKLKLLNTNEQILLEWDDLDWNFKADPKSMAVLDVEKGTQTIQLR